MRILILLFTFLTFCTAASSQKIDELTISDDLLDAQEVYQVESSGEANQSSDYSFSYEYCLIGIHQDISAIEQ